MRSDFLEVALALGHRLADSAIWYRDRCTWIGTSLPGPAGNRIEAALGPDLYGGTSGVALFLAEAAHTLRDDKLRATALGALRHALRHAEPSRPGLYGGTLGIAYAAARVGARLADEHAHASAHALVSAWHPPERHAAFDVIQGAAGTAVALASIVGTVPVTAGYALLAGAETTGSQWSWPSGGGRRMNNLCGYAHGAAGAGHALIELFAATGEERFRSAGEGAFEYERAWVELRAGTWPDLVGVARAAGRDVPVPATTSWCHGAAGSAFARTRVARLLGRPDPDRERALAATREFVAEQLRRVPDDFCLCHGLAGAADALLYANDGSDLATEVGRLGIEHFHGVGRDFPPGLPEGQTPGLLRGLAGVGLFYLRLADPAVPTTLLISHLDRDSARA